jgi:hypothetical protein
MIGQELLAIGSIVLLKGGRKKLCVYGRKQIQLSTNKMYDYICRTILRRWISRPFSVCREHGVEYERVLGSTPSVSIFRE